ncbi:MAG TPA: Crp/Fnr family transcriptional regulator [Verrucomicrobiae bacterium]|jgi:CRP-like cAMP-binding protein|nr:Crp/Fnr family transcriptional regulator [Verrucomicrobiae bacterium]
MKTVGAQCNFLKASPELKSCLQSAGKPERFLVGQVLFKEDQANAGAYLLLKGKVRMSVGGLPKLDRVFSAGSVLGLPSTFTGHAYSLSAEAVSAADVVHVAQEVFVQIMREQPELCRQAAEMLGREVTFIQSALTERRKRTVSQKILDQVAVG